MIFYLSCSNQLLRSLGRIFFFIFLSSCINFNFSVYLGKKPGQSGRLKTQNKPKNNKRNEKSMFFQIIKEESLGTNIPMIFRCLFPLPFSYFVTFLFIQHSITLFHSVFNYHFVHFVFSYHVVLFSSELPHCFNQYSVITLFLSHLCWCATTPLQSLI